LDERTNQTLVHTLQKLLSSDKDWDLKIDPALYAYRISVHDSTKFSPFFLMFNRHPRMAVDYITARSNEVCENQTKSSLPDLQHVMGTLLDIKDKYHSKAHGNICAAQERQKRQYDAKHDSHKVIQ